MHPWTVRVALSAALLMASLAAVAAKPTYKIEVLPTQDGMAPTLPEAINNQGVVFGRALDVNDRRHLSLFLYDQGTMTLVPDSDGAVPEGFNDAGDMLVGIENGRKAVYWHDGRREQLDALRFASGINIHGDIAGQAFFDGVERAAVLANGTLTDLGTLEGRTSFASEISDAGHVTGSSEVKDSKPDQPRRHAFIWFNGQMKDLGTFGGADSYTTGVNNLGHVIGMATNAQHQWKAYFYDGARKQRLPNVVPGMFPMDINNHDEIVGSSDQGVFITTGGRSYLLKDLLKGGDHWDRLDEGLSINDAGDVLGRGRKNGHRETFIARRIRP